MRQAASQRTGRKASRRREGITLVIVLGFLVVLSILALSFAVSMRTERLTSGSYLAMARTRHYLPAVVGRMMNDVDVSLVTNATGRVYPRWSLGGTVYDYLPSPESQANKTLWHLGSNPSWDHQRRQGGLVGSGEDRFVPSALAALVNQAASWYTNNTPLAVWKQPLVDPDVTTNVLAQYYYAVFNLSGFVDVGAACAWPVKARALGMDPTEIDVRPLVSDRYFAWSGYAQWLIETRALVARYNTVLDMYTQASVSPNRFMYPVPFSRCPVGWADANLVAQPSLYVGGGYPETPAGMAAIGTNLAAIALADPNLPANLADYVDADSTPRNVLSYCTEATPLINEVIVTNSVTFGAAGYVYRAQVSVELWFPFATTNNANYGVRLLTPVFSGLPAGLTPVCTPVNLVAAGPWTRDRYGVYSGTIWASPGQSNWTACPTARLSMGVELRDGTDTVVDVVTGLVFAVGASLAEVVGPPSTPFVVDKSADDPRLNWDGTTATQWRDRTPAQSTPGALNDGLTFASGDQATVMYVRNGPLQTIGEFGFLRYNGTEPWKTISLMNDQARVYDRFTLFTNSVMRGLVNPNTGWTNVLVSVFEGVTADRWPGEVTTQVVGRATDWDGSAPPPDGLSARIAAQVVAQSRAALFTNRSDAAKAIGLAAWNSGVQDVMQVEGFLRNSMGLLDPRQNLFGAFVGVFGVDSDVDVMGPGPGFGNARAFVLFWRDPYLSPDRDGSLVHKSLVRYWQQLE